MRYLRSSTKMLAALAATLLLGTQSMACGAETADEEFSFSEEALEESLQEAIARAGARDPGRITPAELAGSYDPNGIPSVSALINDLKLSTFGDRLLVKATFPYPQKKLTTEVLMTVLDEPGLPTFVGTGNVQYNWGSINCAYRVDLVLIVGRNEAGELTLFLRDNRPVAFQTSLPSGASSCPPIRNTWRTHAEPYMKRAPIVDVVMRMTPKITELCEAVTGRTSIVESAKRLTTGPLGAIPPNIYSASGDWERLSTPGRDTTIRAQVREIFKTIDEGIEGLDPVTQGPKLLAAWQERNAACRLSYKGSNGAVIQSSLSNFVKRAYKISFDPYHCPELRWGADASAGAEFATCNTQGEAHMKRYADEQTLRHYLERPPGGTLTPIGSGPATPEDIDFASLIERFAAH
jgi:hypothetical protein